VFDGDEKEAAETKILEKVQPNETVIYIALEGDLLQAVVSGTDEVVTDIIELKRGQSLHNISRVSAVKDDFVHNGEGGLDEDEFEVELDEDEFEGGLDENEFEVELHNGLLDTELDIILVFDGDEKEAAETKILEKVQPNETVIYIALEGDLLQAVIAGTDEVVTDIKLKRDHPLQTISRIDYAGPEL